MHNLSRAELIALPSHTIPDVYKISALTPSKLSSLIPDDEASSTAISVITFVLIRFLLPLCSSLERTNEEVPVSGTSSIIDVGGVGLSRFWGLRSHLQVRRRPASTSLLPFDTDSVN